MKGGAFADVSGQLEPRDWSSWSFRGRQVRLALVLASSVVSQSPEDA